MPVLWDPLHKCNALTNVLERYHQDYSEELKPLIQEGLSRLWGKKQTNQSLKVHVIPRNSHKSDIV